MNQNDHWMYTIREWREPQFHDLLEELFSVPTEIIYDVGACVGGWSYVVSRDFEKPEHRIFAFEPFPANFKVLSENEELKDKVAAINCGIWYGKDEAKAMWRGENVGAIFVDEVDTTSAIDTGEKIQLKTLEYFAECGYPLADVMKLDVEGAEINILSNSYLATVTPQILVEWHYRETIDAVEFFSKHLPHKVVASIGNDMFLLRL